MSVAAIVLVWLGIAIIAFGAGLVGIAATRRRLKAYASTVSKSNIGDRREAPIPVG